mgnify:CR=1 FL=1
MDQALLAGLAAFAFVSSVTPGPNNMMLMASGANFGFRRTAPHMLGVSVGFAVMAALVGLGLAGLFARFPALRSGLTAVSVLYLLWLAWRIARAGRPEAREGARPMTFLEAAAFQWVNPKAWTMALTAVTVYAPAEGLAGLLAVCLVFSAINLPSVASWAAMGVAMRGLLSTERRLRAFNLTMAGLLVLSLAPALFA